MLSIDETLDVNLRPLFPISEVIGTIYGLVTYSYSPDIDFGPQNRRSLTRKATLLVTQQHSGCLGCYLTASVSSKEG